MTIQDIENILDDIRINIMCDPEMSRHKETELYCNLLHYLVNANIDSISAKELCQKALEAEDIIYSQYYLKGVCDGL